MHGIIAIMTIATYHCKMGYDLVGNRRRHCVDPVRYRGHWNGSEPTCITRNIIIQIAFSPSYVGRIFFLETILFILTKGVQLLSRS